jgi:diguanylate cyclase (GGDEF)-like protein
MNNLEVDKEKMRKRKERKKYQQDQHTVMIVDDEPLQLKEFETLLSRDYNVISACDGQEALGYIQKMKQPETISVIISDQRMPVLTGLELFERIIDIIPEAKRIILTGYPEMETILDSVNKYGIYRYLIKPINIDELLQAVQGAVKEFFYYRNLEKHGFTDALTELKNRHYLNVFIEQDIAKVRRDYEELNKNQESPASITGDLSFLMLDIDFFKQVNDAYDSHVPGDRVLKQLAFLLKKESRESDILVRWGGEEFLIVSRFTPRDQAKDLADRLWKAVGKHKFEIESGKTINITCSIGFASYPFLPSHPSLMGWEDVKNIADKVLYAVKNSGRNGWIGIDTTDKTNPDNLYSRINTNIKQLLETCELEYVTSFQGGTTIYWEKR